ncbi:MAG: glycosyltransferase [Planctomycetes bacterium]|nr:glycosyltransferase [Planctomycetota bacterium]
MTELDLSVVIPTYGRAETILRLLDELDRQTLDAQRFEVLVVDDGSPEPVQLDCARYRISVQLLRQANGGPGSARNLAIARARGRWTLILNDDAVPAPDLLERHLRLSRSLPPKTALLGTFRFTARALASPFVQILQKTDLLFDFPHLRHGHDHGWTFFWTCNLSLPTAALRENSFDAETFKEPIVEDVELGYRLAKLGWQVRFDSSLVAEHDHVLEPAGYFRRMVRLGVNMGKMYAKHGDPTLLHMQDKARINSVFCALMRQNVEAFHATSRKLILRLEDLEREQHGQSVPQPLVDQVGTLIRQMGTVCYWRGLLLHFEGQEPSEVLEHGPRHAELTSIVVVSYNALDKTRKCVEALRAAADPRHPTELLFVDNGSSDGSAEWLADQPDIELIRNTSNLGAPLARNQSLARARGRWIVVMDNDAITTAGWLHRLLYHAQLDPKSGCIGPVSDRAAHGQQVPFEGPTDLVSLTEHARRWAQANDRRSRPQNMLTSFCLLMRREVLDALGGFDPRFSPWGFEDDDYTIRSTLAGFRNRCALDVFVRHEHYGGAKAARHNELLQRNWSRFTEKWAARSDVPYGDYKAIEPAFQRQFTSAELHVSLSEPLPIPAALPAAPQTVDA